MINNEEVMGRVYANQVPDSWRILRANRGYFVRNLIFAAILLIGALGLLVWFIQAEDFAFTLGRGTGDLFDFNTWRTIDFVIIGVVILALAYWAYSSYSDLSKHQYQFVALMPEGVLMSKDGKKAETINFGTTGKIDIKRSREDTSLVVRNMTTNKDEKFSLDGRFGDVKALAQTIISGYQHFQSIHAGQGQFPGGQPPLPGQPQPYYGQQPPLPGQPQQGGQFPSQGGQHPGGQFPPQGGQPQR